MDQLDSATQPLQSRRGLLFPFSPVPRFQSVVKYQFSNSVPCFFSCIRLLRGLDVLIFLIGVFGCGSVPADGRGSPRDGADAQGQL